MEEDMEDSCWEGLAKLNKTHS